jgi:hypothetical protein
MGPGLWKLEISNNRSGPVFLNVSEQWVWGESGGSRHLKACIQSQVFIKNLAQYPIKFFKLFWFFNKNPHNHSWFFARFLEMKYSFFFTCTKPIDILGLGFVDYETTIQGSKKKNY